jgi:dCMP deaminase
MDMRVVETWNKWDERYIELARHVAGWSKDPQAAVGAVIVDEHKDRVIALGFNGFPAGVEDSAERLIDPELKNEMVVHAEQNALLFAGRMAKGCSIYIVGKPVCARCAVLIIQAGITRVVARAPLDGTTSKWEKSGKTSIEMFDEADVTFIDSSKYDKGRILRDKFFSA